MPSLRPNELDEFMLDEDELDEVQLRRKKRKEKKAKPYGVKCRKITTEEESKGATDID